MLFLPLLLPVLAFLLLLRLLSLQLRSTFAVPEFSLPVLLLLVEVRVFLFFGLIETIDNGVESLDYVDTFDLGWLCWFGHGNDFERLSVEVGNERLIIGSRMRETCTYLPLVFESNLANGHTAIFLQI